MGSGPFCASYHLDQKDSVSGSGNDAASSTAKAHPMSSMYYFLQNTMLEFPFAWWHKCVLLQSRTITDKDETIHCAEWSEESVSEEDMMNIDGLYSQTDVRGMLKRINGGVTSAGLQSEVDRFTKKLKTALANFSVTGLPGDAQVQEFRRTLAGKDPELAGMARTGAHALYNMRCYKQAFLPSTADAFMSMGSATDTNCAANMLMWVQNKAASTLRYGVHCIFFSMHCVF